MLAEFFLFRAKKGCGIDASILSKLLTPHTTRQKPKMGVQNAELVSALHSHCRGQRFESAMLHHNLSENVKFSDIFYIISIFFAAI